MKKVSLLILLMSCILSAGQFGIQYEYKRINSVGLTIAISQHYSACLKGLVHISRNRRNLGVELSNSFRLFNRGKISSDIDLSVGFLSQAEEYESVDTTGLISRRINTDLLFGLLYSPIKDFSFFSKIGVGMTYSEQEKIGADFLPSIGIRVFIPKKGNDVRQENVDGKRMGGVDE